MKNNKKLNYENFLLMEKDDFIGLKVAKEEKETIKEYALKNGLTITSLIRMAIKEYFENHFQN